MLFYDYIWFFAGRLFLVYLCVAVVLTICAFLYDFIRNRGNCFRAFMAIKFGILLSIISAKKVIAEVCAFFGKHGA